MKLRLAAFLGTLTSLIAPLVTSAHEVYVLSQTQIQHDLFEKPFSEWDILLANFHDFLFWAFIGVLVVLIVFGVSIVRGVEDFGNPLFSKLRRYAPLVARVTIGISFFAAAFYNATYGPELPIVDTYGPYAVLVRGLLVVMGIFITFGIWTRIAALGALIMWGIGWYFHGTYMLTYLNYLGEIIVLLILGAHTVGIDKKPRGTLGRMLSSFRAAFAPYSFLVLRVAFGFSLLYASLYAKFFHNQLALDVAQTPLAGHLYSVAHYLGFEPHFLVLGACIVEIVIALFFMLGIEIRFTALFVEFWLALSLAYFGESVWPHYILIGIPIAFIFYGYDKYSLEGWFFKDPDHQPLF